MSLKIDIAIREPAKATFEKLRPGALFRVSVSVCRHVHMKLSGNRFVGDCNSVSLNDGTIWRCDPAKEVILMNGHLNAEDM